MKTMKQVGTRPQTPAGEPPTRSTRVFFCQLCTCACRFLMARGYMACGARIVEPIVVRQLLLFSVHISGLRTRRA